MDSIHFLHQKNIMHQIRQYPDILHPSHKPKIREEQNSLDIVSCLGSDSGPVRVTLHNIALHCTVPEQWRLYCTLKEDCSAECGYYWAHDKLKPNERTNERTSLQSSLYRKSTKWESTLNKLVLTN